MTTSFSSSSSFPYSLPTHSYKAMARDIMTLLRATAIFDTVNCETVPVLTFFRRTTGVKLEAEFAQLSEGKSRATLLMDSLFDIFEVLDDAGYREAAETIQQFRELLWRAFTTLQRVTR